MKNRNIINYILYSILQLSWGIVQNSLGILIFLICLVIKNKRIIKYYHGAIISYWRLPFSMGCGMFIFFGHYKKSKEYQEHVLSHEYGHTIQSIILGPLFMLAIGLPSIIWAFTPVFVKLRKKGKYTYFSFYPESWADKLGYKLLKIEGASKAHE